MKLPLCTFSAYDHCMQALGKRRLKIRKWQPTRRNNMHVTLVIPTVLKFCCGQSQKTLTKECKPWERAEEQTRNVMRLTCVQVAHRGTVPTGFP